jgi:hypothetical protein
MADARQSERFMGNLGGLDNTTTKKAGLLGGLQAEKASGNPADCDGLDGLVPWLSVPRSPGVWL